MRLRELPEWLSCKAPGHPRDVVGMMQRGENHTHPIVIQIHMLLTKHSSRLVVCVIVCF